jgi:D-glycero-alpha-D-manno-heptose-7-phosphate kinase
MIITRTPFRISFFGGGTDYPSWFREFDGSVLATTINKYCYINMRYLPPFFEHKHRIVYSYIENVKELEEIKHPAVRAIFKELNVNKGLEVHHDGDLPARSGLGSSSSFSVGLINALYALEGKMISKEDLAKSAIYIEQEIIKENVGSQDQISAAFGGFNKISFNKDNSFDVKSIIFPENRREDLHHHLLLFFTGFSRIASEVAESKIANFKNRETELKRMFSMVDEAINIIQDTSIPINEFGTLLHQSWTYKRELSDRVSTPEIDAIYDAALKAGASGGKLLGAGGGGFILFFAKPEFHKKIKTALNHLVHVPFEFENTGSRVLLYQPQSIDLS